uniref:H(+)-exporting diphosphatase n=1 Tax=Neobodo designis TaxID=312471 RepID=A0A7S1QJI6_NEODS|mmetsp:Transcript_47017/g.144949  ORF Transcript_47017/g.144949 Transcript_47017/m.144949 type:complete len:537 (+) Transcript_47017:131-1741(+)
MRHVRALALTVLLCAALAPIGARAETKRLLDCTLESTSFSDCDPMGYGIRAGVYAVPGILLALITFFTCPFFFCARFCCGCCGGSEPTSGCCCSSDKPAIYGTMDIVRPKAYALLLILLGVGVGIWGNLASDQTVQSLLGLVDDLEAAPQMMLDHINRINRELTVTKYNENTDTTFQEDLFNGTSTKQDAEKAKKDIEDALKEHSETFRSYVLDFGFVMFIIFSLPIGSVILGGAAAVCNCRSCIPMLTVFIMFFVGFVLWLGHGVFSSLALVFGDFCAEVDGIAQDQKTVLAAATSCEDATLSSFTDGFQGIENDAAREACGLISNLCYASGRSTTDNINAGTIFDCQSTAPPNCTGVRFGELVEYVEQRLVTDNRVDSFPGAQANGDTCTDLSVPCTAARCSQLCRPSASAARTQSGRNSMKMYTSFQAAAQVSNALDTLGGQYGSCNALAGLLLSPFNGNCKKLAGGSLGMRQSSGLGGIMVIGFVFVMAWGSKRFIAMPSGDDDSEENHEIQLGESHEMSPKKDPAIVPHSN